MFRDYPPVVRFELEGLQLHVLSEYVGASLCGRPRFSEVGGHGVPPLQGK